MYVVCESVAVITTHARVVDASSPIRLNGHAKRPRPHALCGMEIAWDTRLPIEAVRCRDCKRLMAEEAP